MEDVVGFALVGEVAGWDDVDEARVLSWCLEAEAGGAAVDETGSAGGAAAGAHRVALLVWRGWVWGNGGALRKRRWPVPCWCERRELGGIGTVC